MTCSMYLSLVVGLLSNPAGAPALETYTIKLKKEAKGDAGLVVKAESEESKTLVEGPDGNKLTDEVKKVSQSYKYRFESLEKDDKAKSSKSRRIYEKAEATKDGKAVELPYQGKTLLIEKKDGKYRFQIEGGRELTGEDAEFLDKEFNKDRADDKDSTEEIEKYFLPKKAVAVNETWKLDAEGFFKELLKTEKTDIDFSKAAGTGKLLKAYKKDDRQFGEMRFQIEVPLKEIPAGDLKIVLNPGSKMVFDMTVDCCIDGSVRNEAGKGTFELTANGTLVGPDKQEYKVIITSRTTFSETLEEAVKK